MQRDELVERLEGMARKFEIFGPVKDLAAIRDAIAELTRLRAQVPEWRPVSEYATDGVAVLGLWMPSPGAHFNVGPANYGIAVREEGKWYLVDEWDEKDDIMRPDYWQPLAAAPTPQQDEKGVGRG